MLEGGKEFVKFRRMLLMLRFCLGDRGNLLFVHALCGELRERYPELPKVRWSEVQLSGPGNEFGDLFSEVQGR